jgi:hypothetical protein
LLRREIYKVNSSIALALCPGIVPCTVWQVKESTQVLQDPEGRDQSSGQLESGCQAIGQEEARASGWMTMELSTSLWHRAKVLRLATEAYIGQWLTLAILATPEAEISRIEVQSQPRQK